MSVVIAQKDGSAEPIDLSQGGQQGLMRDPNRWVNNSGHIVRKLIAVLVAAPGLMQYFDNPSVEIGKLKVLMEETAQIIDGLKRTLSWEYGESPLGHAGENTYTVTNAKREVSAVTYTWSEKHGQAVASFMTELGRVILMDPDIAHPGIIQFPNYISAGSPSILDDGQSIMMLFFEPDETLTRVTNAWLCVLKPETGGEIIGKREMGGAMEVPTVIIPFKTTSLTGAAPKKMAVDYLKTMKLADVRPANLKAYGDLKGPTPDVLASDEGFVKTAAKAVFTP